MRLACPVRGTHPDQGRTGSGGLGLPQSGHVAAAGARVPGSHFRQPGSSGRHPSLIRTASRFPASHARISTSCWMASRRRSSPAPLYRWIESRRDPQGPRWQPLRRSLQPGELVAIVRASAGLGALQDFTTDHRLLLAAADQVRWNPAGSGLAQTYRPVGMNPAEDAQLGSTLGQEETHGRIRNYTIAVARSLRRLLHWMAGLPGRKSVVILSDNLPLATPDEVDPVSRGKAIESGIGGRSWPACAMGG